MRPLLALCVCGLLLGGNGCTKRYPAKRPPSPPVAKVGVLKVASLRTPSALIDSPVLPGGDPDKLPFDLPLGEGYGIEGAWAGPNQIKGTYEFGRTGDFTVKKGDRSDVDPKEIAAVLEKWITSSGAQRTESSGEELRRSIGYGTAQTVGTISYSVHPDSPAKEVVFHLDVREQPRSTK